MALVHGFLSPEECATVIGRARGHMAPSIVVRSEEALTLTLTPTLTLTLALTPLQELYVGLVPNLVKEAPSSALYLGIYELVRVRGRVRLRVRVRVRARLRVRASALPGHLRAGQS